MNGTLLPPSVGPARRLRSDAGTPCSRICGSGSVGDDLQAPGPPRGPQAWLGSIQELGSVKQAGHTQPTWAPDPGKWGEGEVSVPSTPSHFQTFLVTSFSHLNLVPPPPYPPLVTNWRGRYVRKTDSVIFLQAPQSPESSEPAPYVMIFVILFSVKQQLITGQNSVWRGSGRVFRAVYFIFTASSR